MNAVAASTLTSAELEQGRLFLQQTQNAVNGSINGLSETQWNFRPRAQCWTAAEIVEHMVTVMERVLGPIREQLAAAAPPPPQYDKKVIDEIAIHRFPTRLAKFQAPEFIQPAGRLAPSESLALLEKNYTALRDFLESTPDLRLHAVESRPLQAVSGGEYSWMDGYQWILTAAAHNERHAKQILELRADPDFPA